MQILFSGAGIGGSHATLPSARSAGRRAASSASLVSASAAMTSRKVGNCLLQRAERSTTPRSVTAPYLAEPSTAKVAMRGVTMEAPGRGGAQPLPGVMPLALRTETASGDIKIGRAHV